MMIEKRMWFQRMNIYLWRSIRVILLDSKKFSLSANSRTKKNLEPF